MGHRLTQIATRTGDDGTTGLGDGSRTPKDSLRVAAMGDVDELNSTIGVLLCESLPDDVRAELLEIQHDLFDLGGELCIPASRTSPRPRSRGSMRCSPGTMRRCPGCRSSSCPAARAPPRSRMSHAPCAGVPNAWSWRSAMPSRCARCAVST